MAGRIEILAMFQELMDLLALEDGGRASFRVRAFEKAATTIRESPEPLESMTISKLRNTDGLGKSTAKCIHEFYATGRIARLEELRALYPREFVALTHIPGIGAKTALRFRDELNIHSVSDLRIAIANKEVRKLVGLGAGIENKIAKALDHLGSKQNRRPIHKVLPIAEVMVKELLELPEVQEAHYCGSLRRFQETIADIDIVAVSDTPRTVMDYFLNAPRIADVTVHGDRTASVFLESGIQVDFRITKASELGAALLYFTGSKAHNIRLRVRAHELGYALNEHSLHHRDSGEIVASATEQEVYEALGMRFIEPTMRQDLGEIEAAMTSSIPQLLRLGDIKGDLHVHCDFSGDAKSPVEEMVQTAHNLGYEYLAISDHAENLRFSGVTAARHRELAERLGTLRTRFPEMLILHGCELNIGKTGDLDYTDEEREMFDICLASVHSHFDLGESAQTDRLIRAMEEPCVRILGHMLGRHIGKRPGIDINVDAVLEAALENDVAIEINSGLSRLDPPPSIVRRGCELGCLFVVNSDAHHKDHLQGIRFGVTHSHRGWLPKDRVVNAWGQELFKEWLFEPFD